MVKGVEHKYINFTQAFAVLKIIALWGGREIKQPILWEECIYVSSFDSSHFSMSKKERTGIEETDACIKSSLRLSSFRGNSDHRICFVVLLLTFREEPGLAMKIDCGFEVSWVFLKIEIRIILLMSKKKAQEYFVTPFLDNSTDVG